MGASAQGTVGWCLVEQDCQEVARVGKEDMVAKAKEDRRIRAEIVRCAKGVTSGDLSASVSAPRSSFITEGSVLD